MVFFTTSLLGALYIFVFGKFYAHLRAFKNLEVKKTTKNQFSIIIPFRNEAANLAAIFKDLTNLNYPRNKFEVLFTDDHSEDEDV